MSEGKRFREFTLARAAWAPEGRLVAYEGQMLPPTDGEKIEVIEKVHYDKAIARIQHLEGINSAMYKFLASLDQSIDTLNAELEKVK